MLPSVSALFFFEAAARTGSFTRAASELNVTQPAVSRMISRLETHLGVTLFTRTAGGTALTEAGLLLQRPVTGAFRAIEDGLNALEARRSGVEAVTLSLSSAFTTHWLMPKLGALKLRFPHVDLRYQLIAGPLRGPVDMVDLAMRFSDTSEGDTAAFLMHEVIFPVCQPTYLQDRSGAGSITAIDLVDSRLGWAESYDDLRRQSGNIFETLRFPDYAVVVQAALLGQGVALGWLTVASHWLLAGALVPASSQIVRTQRRCDLVLPKGKSPRPVTIEIRDWIIAEMRSDVAAIDRLFPHLALLSAAFGDADGGVTA